MNENLNLEDLTPYNATMHKISKWANTITLIGMVVSIFLQPSLVILFLLLNMLAQQAVNNHEFLRVANILKDRTDTLKDEIDVLESQRRNSRPIE